MKIIHRYDGNIMMTKNYIFTVTILFGFSICAFQGPWQIIRYENRGECERRIVFLQDSTQKQFVLKCYGDDQKEEAICEELGSFIGGVVGAPVHTADMIIGWPLLTEINNNTSLATLHECVPGRELGKWFEKVAHDITLKGGLLSERHLNSLVISNDLCDIVALDIFLSNRDRHHENCFFDESTMRYYGIDMGDIFLDVQKFPNIEKNVSAELFEAFLTVIVEKKIMALNAYNFLCTLNSQDLSPDRIKALRRVCDTLQNLVNVYSADSLFDTWMAKAEAIGFIYTRYKKFYMKLFLHFNMYWVQQVIDVINELVI